MKYGINCEGRVLTPGLFPYLTLSKIIHSTKPGNLTIEHAIKLSSIKKKIFFRSFTTYIWLEIVGGIAAHICPLEYFAIAAFVFVV